MSLDAGGATASSRKECIYGRKTAVYSFKKCSKLLKRTRMLYTYIACLLGGHSMQECVRRIKKIAREK